MRHVHASLIKIPAKRNILNKSDCHLVHSGTVCYS